MTYKEFYNWTKQYLGTRLENKKIDIVPIVEKLGEVNNKNNMRDRINVYGEWYVRENTQKKQSYKLGDTLYLNFDYEGMLDCGLLITNNTGVNDLEKLLTSFEDVNYHREANPLYDLIEHKKYQNEYGSNEVTRENIDKSLWIFKRECEDTLKNIVSTITRIDEEEMN
tara:strand:+ start:569 stop:1072 length:504 start_codon:yes stop_codon:yes gene_type:complete